MSGLSEEGRLYVETPVAHVDTGSARVAYRKFGSGEPLLLIHGWPFSGFIWRKILPALAQRYTCYTVDLPGAGETEWRPGNDFSFHGHAEHLKRLAEELGLRAYRLVAHDTGATVARRLAILEGANVVGSVLIDTEIPNHRPPLVPFFQKVLALPGSNWAMRQLMKSRRFRRSSMGFGGCFVDKTLMDGEFHDQLVAPLVADPRRMEGQIRYARGIDWKQLDGLKEGHGQIEGPVLLIWGDRDPFFPIEEARAMIPQFRKCLGLIEIPQAKLLPHEEHPGLVGTHVLEFFEKNRD